MADIDVVIIDPGGYRFDQLLDNYMAMRALVPLLVARLGLPEELKYQLIPRATGRAMQLTDTLASIGAASGAEIDLKPFRDDAFARILDGLYKEAEKYVVQQLWAEAKKILDLLFRLEPEHPDPERLRNKVEVNIGVTSPPPPSQPGTQPQTTTPAQTSSVGCWVIVLIVAFVVVFVWKPWNASNSNSNRQRQTKGSFTAELVPAGDSYYFKVTARSGENIEVTVRGSDGFPNSSAGERGDFAGSGSLTTDVIPKGKPGVEDTITVRSRDSGEVQIFTFRFQ